MPPDEGDDKTETPVTSDFVPPVSKRRKFPKNKEFCADIYSSSRVISIFKALTDFDLYSNEHYGVNVFDQIGNLPSSQR